MAGGEGRCRQPGTAGRCSIPVGKVVSARAALASLRGVLVVCAAFLPAFAAAETGILDRAPDEIEDVENAEIGFRAGSLVVVPIPFSNPVIGSGLAGGVGYLYKNPGSKSSRLGFGGFRSDNGSQGIGFGTTIHFDNDRWRFEAVGADAELNYDLTLRGTQASIIQSGQVIRFGGSRAVTSELDLGATLNYLESEISLAGSTNSPLPPSLAPDADIALTRLELSATWDARNDDFYPSNGVLANLTASFGTQVNEFFGGNVKLRDRDYQKVVGSAAAYRPLGREGIVAGRIVLCGASDLTPFFDLCGLGLTDAMRGFGATEFLEQYSASLQAEYRGRLSDRFGYVVFAGTGGIGQTASDAFSNGQRVAAGAGMRIRLSKKFKLDYAIDAAVRDDGEELLYLSVGQRW